MEERIGGKEWSKGMEQWDGDGAMEWNNVRMEWSKEMEWSKNGMSKGMEWSKERSMGIEQGDGDRQAIPLLHSLHSFALFPC